MKVSRKEIQMTTTYCYGYISISMRDKLVRRLNEVTMTDEVTSLQVMPKYLKGGARLYSPPKAHPVI